MFKCIPVVEVLSLFDVDEVLEVARSANNHNRWVAGLGSHTRVCPQNGSEQMVFGSRGP